VRAEFYRKEGGDEAIAWARWTDRGVRIRATDEQARVALGRIFHPRPLVVDDASLRSFGTSGPLVLQPGSLPWFRSAAQARAQDEGLEVRLVAEEEGTMGWDPAGAYRTFADQVAHRVRNASEAGRGEQEARETAR
jgi:hypothetical protein